MNTALLSTSAKDASSGYGEDAGEEEEGSSALSLSGLPVEVQLEIAGWLAVSDLARLGMTSQAMSHLADHPSIWKNNCFSRFFSSSSSRSQPGRDRVGVEDQSTATGRGVARAKSQGNCNWNEWKRVYHRFHHHDKQWRTKPKVTRIELDEPSGYIWLDSRKVYTCYDGVHVYNFDSGEKLKEYCTPTSRTEREVLSWVQASEKDGIVAGVAPEAIHLWNLHTDEYMGEVPPKIMIWTMHYHDKKLGANVGLVCGGNFSKIIVVDLETQTHIIDGGSTHRVGVIRAVQLEGNVLATGSGNGEDALRLYDLRDHQRPTATFEDFAHGIWCLHFADNLIAVGSKDQACLLDMRTRKKVWDNPAAHADHINVIQFDNRKMITGCGDSIIKAWDMQTFECWWQVKVSGSVRSGRYEEDALVVATPSAKHVVRLGFEPS